MLHHPYSGSIRVTHQRGSIELPESGLWLDPHGRSEVAFVSHAHSDHVGRHKLTFCTPLTQRLMQARYKLKGEFVALEFGQTHEWNGHTLRLLPAGHIIGSAMLHLTRHSDGATLLYTGDYKLRVGLTTPQARLMQADTLIMETTFGLPRYVFPPTEQIVAGIVKFVQQTIADEHHPVLLGYSLGKAQELLAAVRGAKVPVMLHQSVMALMPICAEVMNDLPAYRLFEAAESDGHALIFPPTGGKTAAYREMKRTRTAMITGWALDSGMKYRFQVDEVFPLSDHADYPELLRTVEEVKPKRIYTVHGYTREFSADLRRRGYDAWSLAADDQMELGLV